MRGKRGNEELREKRKLTEQSNNSVGGIEKER